VYDRASNGAYVKLTSITRADPWVEEDNSWCPGEGPSLAALLRLSGTQRVGCYASIPLTFRAYRASEPPVTAGGNAYPPSMITPASRPFR
jgi:hypothetical protein